MAQYSKDFFLGKLSTVFERLKIGLHYVELGKNQNLNVWKRMD